MAAVEVKVEVHGGREGEARGSLTVCVSSSTLVSELRTSSLGPKQYYELYMAVFDALRHLAVYLRENHPVMLGSEPVDCIVYPVSPQHIAGRPVITGGDWVAHRLSRG